MSGSDIRTGAWEGRCADSVDTARIFRKMGRISGGGGGRIPGGWRIYRFMGHWAKSRSLLPLDSCLWFLVSCLSHSHGWEIVPPSMRRAVGTRGGWVLAVPRLPPWAGMRRRVATGGSGCAAVLGYLLLGDAGRLCGGDDVIGYWGMRFSSKIHDLRSPSRPSLLCGESFRRGRAWDAGARRTGD